MVANDTLSESILLQLRFSAKATMENTARNEELWPSSQKCAKGLLAFASMIFVNGPGHWTTVCCSEKSQFTVAFASESATIDTRTRK